MLGFFTDPQLMRCITNLTPKKSLVPEEGGAVVIASCDDRSSTMTLHKLAFDDPVYVLSLGASRWEVKIRTRGREERIAVAAALGVRRSMTTQVTAESALSGKP